MIPGVCPVCGPLMFLHGIEEREHVDGCQKITAGIRRIKRAEQARKRKAAAEAEAE